MFLSFLMMTCIE